MPLLALSSEAPHHSALLYASKQQQQQLYISQLATQADLSSQVID